MPNIKSMVIFFEVNFASEIYKEAIFVSHFHNKDRDVHIWFQVEGLCHYCWLQ